MTTANSNGAKETIDLELTEELKSTQMIEHFRFNPELSQGLLKLNGVHNETPAIVFSITFDKYDDIKKDDIEFLIKKLASIDAESFDISSIVEVLYYILIVTKKR
jgi:hypothetical protein